MWKKDNNQELDQVSGLEKITQVNVEWDHICKALVLFSFWLREYKIECHPYEKLPFLN